MAYIGAGISRFNTADELTVTGDAQIDTTTLVVDSTNNRVGIGTTSPDVPLNVESAASATKIKYAGTSNAHFGLQIESNISGGNFESDFANGTTAMLDLFANSAATSGGDFFVARTQASDPVLLVKGNGNVGIGTASPATALDVTGTVTITTADNTPQLTLKSTDADASSGPELDLIRESASPADNDELGHISFKGQNDATSPETIAYAEIDTFLRDATDGTEDGELRLNVRRDGTLREGISVGADVVFNEGGIDVDVRMESLGNTSMFFLDGGNNTVGIGTGSPTNPLTVRGTAGTGNSAAIRIKDESDQGATLGIFNSGNVGFNAEQGDIFFTFNTVGKFEFKSGGDLEITDGNLKVASGHGIDFSSTSNSTGTMSAELFDDYEEGTWTPGFTTNSGSAASGSVSGRYTKIGRAVFVTANINNINTSGTTGSSILRINNLPFTCEGLSMHGTAAADNVSFQGSRTQITALFSTADLVQFPQTGTGTGDTPTDHSDINSGTSDILFSGVYFSDQ